MSGITYILHSKYKVYMQIFFKAFDSVWHGGLVHKLKSNGFLGDFPKFMDSFLRNKHQKVVLNVNNCNWRKTNASVPEGSK